ncbi:MAG: bacillithiol system redox-active protein YtxJ [Flammeovirgaceae bacterium]
MNWTPLTTHSQLAEIKIESNQHPVLLFKHSTSCSISNTSLNRLERNWNDEELKGTKIYYLDLLTYRSISNEIAQLFGIEHESPQVIIIKNGDAIYNASHFDIDYNSIKAQVKKLQIKN